ncbi:MAG: thiamine phosphate synthase [Acidobacteria bacterium]|nr:thiamine phosphate synthase [Acidobacteriota bacterium]MBI3473501.1 thiamine phosphate synthase [Candidatus Solibacter usitatus]
MPLPRLYPILDTASLAAKALALEPAARALIAGGAGILQLRHKGHWSRGLFEEASRIRRLCREAGVTLVINDRADFALLLDAGLHVGQDDLPAQDARRLLGGQHLLGYSTHNAGQVRAGDAEPADYLALGPIFSTGSKPNPDPVVGLERLRQWRSLTQKPLVAIGGITRRTARAVVQAGADSVAVIGDLLPEPCTEDAVRERMEQWRQLLSQ